MMSSESFTSRRVAIILLVWCIIALMLGATGVMAAVRPPFPQAILFGLVVLLLIAYRLHLTAARAFRSPSRPNLSILIAPALSPQRR